MGKPFGSVDSLDSYRPLCPHLSTGENGVPRDTVRHLGVPENERQQGSQKEEAFLNGRRKPPILGVLFCGI